ATSRMPTVAEQDRARAQLEPLRAGLDIEGGPRYGTDPTPWILAGAAALITLGAAGVGTGLAAADSRADLSTLAAVGASPKLRRGLSLSQSGVIAGLGSLLGAGAGLGAAVAIITGLNQQFIEVWPGPSPLPIVVPWLSLAIALLVVPGLAMAGAGLLTRSRLPIERRT
ncbi:MAG TPA: FtsX-like permease family protein, partial [Micromonosporaceae bacterium]